MENRWSGATGFQPRRYRPVDNTFSECGGFAWLDRRWFPRRLCISLTVPSASASRPRTFFTVPDKNKKTSKQLLSNPTQTYQYLFFEDLDASVWIALYQEVVSLSKALSFPFSKTTPAHHAPPRPASPSLECRGVCNLRESAIPDWLRFPPTILLRIEVGSLRHSAFRG